MNPAKKNTEHTIKDKFLDHEFEVDSGMWDDMEQKLDQGSNGPNNGFGDGFRKGWFLLALLLLLLLSVFIWQRSSDQETISVNQVDTNSEKAAQLKSPLADENAYSLDDSGNSKVNNPVTKEEKIEDNDEDAVTNDTKVFGNSSARKAPRKKTTKNQAFGDLVSSSGNKEISSFDTTQHGTSTNPGAKIINPEIAADSSLFKTTIVDETANESLVVIEGSAVVQPSNASGERKSHLEILDKPIRLIEKSDRDESETLKKWWRSLPKSVIKPSPWSFKVQAGALIPDLQSTNTLNTGEEISWDNSSALYLQLATAYHLNERISLASSLKYSKIPYRFDLTYTDIDGNRIVDRTEQSIRQLSVPLIANYHLQNGLSLSGGLGNTFRKVNSPFEKLFGVEDVDKLYKITSNLYKPSLSFWQAGVGFDLASWSLEASYQRYFGSTTKDFDFEEERFKTDTKEWSLNLALIYNIHPKNRIALTKTKESKKLKRLFWGMGFAMGRNYFSGSNSIVDLNLNIWDDFSTYKINTLTYFQLKKRFRLQAELWYHHTRLPFEVDPSLSSDPFNASDIMKINSLELPITLHFNPVKNFRLISGIGMQFNFLKTVESITYPANPDFAAFYNSVPASFQKRLPFYDLGIGLDWKQFGVDLRFRSMIGNFVDDVVYDQVSYNFTSNNYQWFLGINYILGRD